MASTARYFVIQNVPDTATSLAGFSGLLFVGEDAQEKAIALATTNAQSVSRVKSRIFKEVLSVEPETAPVKVKQIF